MVVKLMATHIVWMCPARVALNRLTRDGHQEPANVELNASETLT
jgi:hypothetical protein